VWPLLLFTVAVLLFELWYVAAFLAAYTQTRDRMLLLMVGHSLLMLVALAYFSLSLLYNQPVNLFVVVVLLLGAVVLALSWQRHPAGLAQSRKSYPRGTLDVLAFRRPAADLKRRVRTK
jgi:hypothetical protein